MKTLHYKFILILTAVALITACEDENIDPVSNSSNGSSTKTKSLNTKSAGFDAETFGNFLTYNNP